MDSSDNTFGGPDGVPAAGLPEARVLRRRKLLLLTGITSNIFGNMGFTALTIAAPAIQADMRLSAAQIGWILLSAMLAMAAISAPVARLSDIVGRRKVTIAGLYVAAAGQALNALCVTFPAFVAARVLTGAGLVAFFTTATAMVAAAYPKEERGRVLGLVIGSVYLSLSLGPIVGGFLVQAFGWSSLFWFGAVSMIPPIVLIHLVEGEDPTEDVKLDKSGSLLWMLAVTLGFTGFTTLGERFALPLLCAGIVLFMAFVWRNVKSPSPMVDFSLFRDSRRFTFSSLAAFISYVSSFSITMLLSLYFQYSKGLPPAVTGFIMVSQPLVQTVLTPIAGRLSDRFDAGLLSSLGLGVILAGILLMALFLDAAAPLPLVVTAMSLCGAGFALFGAPNTNAIMSSVPPWRIGQASGVIAVTRLTGQISSMALTTLVFAQVIGPGEITPEKYPAFITAARVLFWIFAPMCLLGVFASRARGRAESPTGTAGKGAGEAAGA
ncbi:MAG: MFS transporter [Deltaproteobacteria bacterium]|jgi:MFS family permease|nr:MFS transporter [Deltaproteobacteria bacterium]